MLANKKIAAVVVWYNPSNEVIENIGMQEKIEEIEQTEDQFQGNCNHQHM